MSLRWDDFGAELRRRRMSAGMSLRDLAGRVHYSGGHLSKVETGHKPPSADLARLCDAALNAGGELVALLVEPSRESAVPDVASGGWTMGLDTEGSGWFAPLDRRQFLASAALPALVGFSIDSPAPARAELLESALGMFRAWFDQLRMLGQQGSPGLILSQLIGSTHSLRALHHAAPSAMRPRVLALAARYAEYTGWMSQEMGDHRATLWWTDHAVELATAGGDSSLSAYAQVRKALITLYLDDPCQTVELARQAGSQSRTPPRIRGLAALREAQGLALTNDHAACLRTLDRARDLLARDVHDPITPVLGTSTITDPVSMVAGWCKHELGRPRDAADLLDKELERIPHAAIRSRTRWGVRRAMAYAAQGEAEHAALLTREMLPEIAAVASATIRYDLRKLSRMLIRWGSQPAVRQLLPDLNIALRTPMTG